MIMLLTLLLAADTVVIDSFDSVGQWTTNPAAGVEISIHSDTGAHGRGMRIDFDFHGHPGYGIVHRAVNLELPANYQFSFALRGAAPTNTLELKLIESNDSTVWWSRNQAFEFPRRWTTFSRTRSRICYAWGPHPNIGGQLRKISALEIAISAGSVGSPGSGGKGSIWIDDLALVPLAPESPFTIVDASRTNPLIGTWESAVVSGGDGVKLDFGPDSSFHTTGGLMDPFTYELVGNRVRWEWENHLSNRRFAGTVSARGDSLVIKSDDTSEEFRAARVGPAMGSGINGVWVFRDGPQEFGFVRFGADGQGEFRTPLRECVGTWTAANGRITADLNGERREIDFTVSGDVLTLRSPAGEIKYKRR